MYRAWRSNPTLPTRIILYLLTNNAGEKDVVGRMPLFEFYISSILLTTLPGVV